MAPLDTGLEEPPLTSPQERVPLIGRERQWDVLCQRLAAAAAGSGSVVLIAGEPGAGKTRLLTALAAEATAAGAAVLRGGASDAVGMPPYLPFIEALSPYVRAAPPDRLRQAVGQFAPALATILPEVAERLGEADSQLRLPPEQERFRLFEAAGELLTAMAAAAPLVLILDDLHWADPSTLDLLCAVTRRLPFNRVLIAGAYREGDAEDNPAFGRAFAELSRQRTLTALVVGPLPPAAIAALAAAVLAAPLAPDAADLLAARSEGNPFFAEELLRGWLETGALAQPAGVGGAFRLVGPEPTAIPATIRAAVSQRLDRLTPETVDVLHSAAIAGRDVDPALLAQIVGDEAEAVEARLLEAARARLLRQEADGAFAFSHDTVRECLYADVSPIRRRRIHGFAGHALEEASGLLPARRPAELAFHYVRSGDKERAVTWSRRAAEQALVASAPREAMRHFQTARDLMPADDADRGALLLALGEAALLADDDLATAAFAAAEVWFRQRRQWPDAARAAHRLGDAHWRQERTTDARGAFTSALALAGDGASPERIRILIDLGSLLTVSLHAHEEGITLVREAATLAEQTADRRLQASATRALGNLLVRRGALRDGIDLLEAALRLAEEESDPVEAAECCACLAPAWFWLGEIERSAAVTHRRLAHARQVQDRYQLRHVYTWLAICDGVRGRIATSEAWLDRAEEIVAHLGSPEPAALLDFCRGAAAFFRGDLERAEALLQEAIARFRAFGPGSLVWYLGWLGLVQASRGNIAAARAVMAELEGLVMGLPGPDPPGEPLVYLVQIALLLDDRERLARHAAALAPLAGRFHDTLVDRLLGETAARQGDVAEAERLLLSAEAVARRERLPWELGRVLEARADLALAQGQWPASPAVTALLQEAATQCDLLQNRGEAERLRGRCQAAPGTPDGPLPAALTPREADVLRLVAAGKTTREAAAALFLSEKTIEHHISRTYAKTGAENRAAATAYAIRHGLA